MITKIINRSILILIVFSVAAFAQQKAFIQQAAQEKISGEESYPVYARPFLERFNKANGIDEAQLSKERVLNKTNKTAWNFVVGSQKNWWASDLASNTFYTTPTTCRAVGSTCYIFVEDSLWTNGRVTQAAVDSVRIAFDSKTPANSSKGIYQTDVETFGDPPNVDGDSKIIIFILNIKDGYTGTGGYVAGYFYSVNQSMTHANSNKAEIYYLDANPLNLKSANGITSGMKTTAHEFQHMIHWNYIPSSEIFFNEGWSLVAEVVNGYSLNNQSYFVGESNHYLLDWRSNDNTAVLKDYSRAARFSLYLKEQFGTAILKNYLSNKINGVTGLNYYMTSVGSRTFSSVLVDWWLANFLNENVGNTHPEWVYTYTPITKVSSNVTYTNPNITNGMTSGLYKYSAEYLTFNSAKNLKINFNTVGNGYIQIKAIKVGANTKVIENVTPGTDYAVPDLGTTYSSVTFMIYHNNGNDGFTGPTVYTFNSTGTAVHTVQEIAYDTKEPTGVYDWPIGDSVAVVFSGIQGAKLDSIKVALRTLSPLQGGVWRLANSTSGTPLLGKKLAVPITVSGNTYVTGTYPPHWTNWGKVDLRSYNIDASTNFVVSFVIDGKYQGGGFPNGPNRVMSTYQQSSNSRTYTASSGAWFNYYVDNVSPQDSFIVYIIRAYVSSGPTGVNEPIELLPSSFSLEQNYPNPFNPSTVISYQLPVAGHVSLKVFDMLGREVATLIDEFQQAGKYNSQFSILNSELSSGVYFYTLTAGNKIETKKMLLLK
ncbi:MAG: T9SS type A sorting domain-containing protein [Melioribacteraceae bacterium]